MPPAGPRPTGPARPVRVAVIDDHPVYRRGVADAVAACPDLELVAAAGSLLEYEVLTAGRHVDVAVLDLRLPDVRDEDGIRRLAARRVLVLVLSAEADPARVHRAVAAGARGYLSKLADLDEIVRSVRAVAGGGTVLPAEDLPAVGGLDKLTDREREVLALVAAGCTDKAIAARLVIALPTVRSHLDSIRDKTGHRRRADLTRFALSAGVGPG